MTSRIAELDDCIDRHAKHPLTRPGQSHLNSDGDYQPENADQDRRTETVRAFASAFPTDQPGFCILEAIALLTRLVGAGVYCVDRANRLSYGFDVSGATGGAWPADGRLQRDGG